MENEKEDEDRKEQTEPEEDPLYTVFCPLYPFSYLGQVSMESLYAAGQAD